MSTPATLQPDLPPSAPGTTVGLPQVPAGPPDADPPLAAPPADGALHGLDPLAHRAFKVLNRWVMVPAHRAGLGAWLGTPVGGYMLLLHARGRRSGLVRETPLSYLVADGSIWVVAGFGPRTDWYRNVLADPAVEVFLPGRLVIGTATEVRAPAVRGRILPTLARSMGLPSFLGGVNPWRSTDDEIVRALDFVPLIRIDSRDGWLDAGPDDPGGMAWVWRQAVVLGVTLVAVRVARRLLARLV